jgi:hypothetical protein
MADQLAVPDNLAAMLSNYLQDLTVRSNQVAAGGNQIRALINAAAGLPEENTNPDVTDDPTSKEYLASALPQAEDFSKLARGVGQAFNDLSGKSPDLSATFNAADEDAADKARGFGDFGVETGAPKAIP